MRTVRYTLSRTCEDCGRTFVTVVEPPAEWPAKCPSCEDVEHDLGGEA